MSDLLRAYLKYADSLKLGYEIIHKTESSISVKIDGKNAYDAFRHETGKHCVQRVPPTESKGRRHTSIISVAVLKLEEDEYQLDPRDIDITTQRGHGKGGQHQNTTDSAVRAVHKPTGIHVFINGRDQHDNKQLALSVLSSRVKAKFEEEAQLRQNSQRRAQIGDCARSGKVRTYNFIESVVTDHQLGRKTRDIKGFFKGNLTLILDPRGN